MQTSVTNESSRAELSRSQVCRVDLDFWIDLDRCLKTQDRLRSDRCNIQVGSTRIESVEPSRSSCADQLSSVSSVKSQCNRLSCICGPLDIEIPLHFMCQLKQQCNTFAVPATGAGVEPQFSKSRRIASWARSRMNPNTICESIKYNDYLSCTGQPLTRSKWRRTTTTQPEPESADDDEAHSEEDEEYKIQMIVWNKE